jgi:hypothetical protein
VPQVLGQRLSQVVLIEHQQPVESSRRRVPMILSQMAFALGACGGLARILGPSAVNTASKQAVNWPGAISDQEPD